MWKSDVKRCVEVSRTVPVSIKAQTWRAASIFTAELSGGCSVSISYAGPLWVPETITKSQ